MTDNTHNIFRGTSTEIDYGDVPDNMDEDQMRAYLQAESKLVMPDQKKRDSFDKEWKNKRNVYTNNPNPNNYSFHKKQFNYNNNNNNNNNHNNNQYAFQSQIKQQQQQQQQQHNNFNKYKNINNTNTNNNHNNANNPTSHTNANNTANNDNNPSSQSDYTMVDRMSTVTMVTNASTKHKSVHSFEKQPVPQPMYTNNMNNNNNNNNHQQSNSKLPILNQSMPQNQTGNLPHNHKNNNPNSTFPHNPNLPIHTHNNKNKNSNGYQQRTVPMSALSKQIKPTQHQQQQSGIGSNIIQSRNPEGKLVVKQMPYSKKTHAMVHVHVEISSDHIEHIIVYFFKHYSVQQFTTFLKEETNNGSFKDCEVNIFVADDDGDLDDDFPAPELTSIIANLGLKHFYIKISNANDQMRNDMRRDTQAYKSQLMTTEQVDHMETLNDDDEYEDDSDDDDDNTRSCCIIL